MRLVRGLAVLLAVLALFGAAAACGGGPREAVISASGALRDADTARLDLLLTFELAGSAEPFTLRGKGSIDYATERSATTFELPGGVVEVIGDGAAVFLRAPNNPYVADATTWLRVDASGVIDDVEDGLGVVSGTDPGRVLDNMAAAGEVTKVGDERIDGAATTHYRARLDPNRASGQLTFLQRAQVDQLKRQGKEFSLTVDAWLDREGRPRRLRSLSEVQGVVVATFTMTFSDFGAPVAIAVPMGPEIGHRQRASTMSEVFEIGQEIGVGAAR